MHTYVHHVYTQAPGGLKICGYYSKYLAMSEGRHCYFLSIATGGNNCYLLPGLTDPSGVVLTGDKSTSLIKRRRSLYIEHRAHAWRRAVPTDPNTHAPNLPNTTLPALP